MSEIPFLSATEWGEEYVEEWINLVRSGRKTLLVLPVEPQPEFDGDLWAFAGDCWNYFDLEDEALAKCPYPVGSVLVVNSLVFREGARLLQLEVTSVECKWVLRISDLHAYAAGFNITMRDSNGNCWQQQEGEALRQRWEKVHGEKYPVDMSWAWLLRVKVL